MPLDPSVDKVRVRGRALNSLGNPTPPPSFFPTVQRLVNKVSHSRIEMVPVGPYDNQSDGTASAAAYWNPTTGDWWADLIAVDDADVLASGQTQWGQWGVDDRGQRYYIEPKLVSPTFYGNPTTGAPLAQGSGGIRTVWLDDLVQLFSPTVIQGFGGLVTEDAQDLVAAMLSGGTRTGIDFAYDDPAGVINTTVTVTGDLPESAAANSPNVAAVTPATGLLGKTTRFTGAVSQPAPPALPGRVFAVGVQTTGLTLNRDGTDVFIDDAGNSSTTFRPPTVGVRTLHCSVAGQWRTTGGHVPTGVLDARFVRYLDAVADDTTGVSAVFQAALDALGALGGGMLVVPPKTARYAFDTTIFIPDNVTVWAYGARMRAKANCGYMVMAKGQQTGLLAPSAVTANPSASGGSLAAGSYAYKVTAVNATGETVPCPEVTATVTGSTGSVALSWTAPVVPAGASPVTSYRVFGRTSGATNVLLGTTSTTSFTDTGAAGTAATPPPVINTTFGRTAGIRVFGGTWDANQPTNAASGTWVSGPYAGHCFNLQKIDQCTIRDATVLNAAKWAIAVADFTNLTTENITFGTNSDGAHVLGPGRTWRARNLYGTVGDDMIGVSSVEWPTYAVSEGDVDDVQAQNAKVVSGFSIVRLLGGTGTVISNVYLEKLGGSISAGSTAVAAVYANDDQYNPGRTGTVVKNLVIRDVDVVTAVPKPVIALGSTSIDRCVLQGIRAHGDNCPALQTFAGSIGKLIIDDVDHLDSGNSTATNVLNLNTGIFGEVEISRVRFANPTHAAATFLVFIGAAVVIDQLRMRACSFVAGGTVGELLRVNDGATIGAAQLTDMRQKNGAAMVYLNGATIAAAAWALTNIVIDGAQNMYKLKNPVTDLLLANVRTSVAAAAIGLFGTSASLIMRGSGVTPVAGNFISKDGTQTVRSRSLNIAAPANVLTPIAGDMVENTNAATAGGTGPIVYDGTSWKPVGRPLASGTAVLAAGTVNVAQSLVTANSLIRLTTIAPGGTVGNAYVSARTAGTGFTITSTSNADTSTVFWELVQY